MLDRWRQNWNPWYANFDLSMTKGKAVAIRIEWEPNAGYMRPEALIDAQIAGARRAGATVSTDTVVERIGQAGDRVRLETNAGAFTARHVVVAAGAWTRKLLGPPYDGLLTVTRQVVRWYAVEDPSSFRAEKMPVCCV